MASVILGTNADLVAAVAQLYLSPGMTVADVTYSTGRFWARTDVSKYRFLASDLHPSPQARRPVLAADFRALPYRDASVDCVVLDPPYLHAPGRALMRDRYNGRTVDPLATQDGIMALYRGGLAEAARVLRPGGQAWVKVGDSLASERQRWNHIAVHQAGLELGYYPRDLVMLVPPAPMALAAGGRWPRQLHARKVATYLWVLDAGGYRPRR